MLTAEFSRQMAIVRWQGGVTRNEKKTIRTPKPGERKRLGSFLVGSVSVRTVD